METLGDRLARLMAEKGTNPTRLARQHGFSQGRLREIVTGQTSSPRADTLQRLAEALGVSPDYLITGHRPEAALAEGDCAAYDPGEARGLLYLLAPNARHPAAYRIARPLPGFDLAAGDTLVVELQGQPRPGQLVVTNMADTETGSADTVVRRYLPPLLLAQDGQTVLRDSDTRLGGLWPVLASWRVSPENG